MATQGLFVWRFLLWFLLFLLWVLLLTGLGLCLRPFLWSRLSILRPSLLLLLLRPLLS